MDSKGFENYTKGLAASECTAYLVMAYDTAVEAFKHFNSADFDGGGEFSDEWERARHGTVEAFDEVRVKLMECIGLAVASHKGARGDFGGMV